MKVAVLGASGTIGRAVVRALRDRGFDAIPVMRTAADSAAVVCAEFGRLAVVLTDVRPDAVVSCVASRTGTPRDSWAVDHDAQVLALDAAVAAGAAHFVLLSAICVQRPRLAFQFAKLAFEERLRAAPLQHSVVRPTAYFKSMSGQVARVAAGKPFLVFGDGRLTATKPISDADCAAFLVGCLTRPEAAGATLPVGGPGPALAPADQAEMLSRLLGREVPVRRVSPRLLRGIGGVLAAAGRVAPRLGETAALAAIGHYYATESMLVWDEARGCYDADATPETGAGRLEDHYAALLAGEASADLGSHAIF